MIRAFACVSKPQNRHHISTADNQRLMAEEGGIQCLVQLLDSPSDLIQRQSAKALANLGRHCC